MATGGSLTALVAEEADRHVRRPTSWRRRTALPWGLLAGSVALPGCGLVLGIDDVPAVTGHPDSGPGDARLDKRSGDAQADRADAGRDVQSPRDHAARDVMAGDASTASLPQPEGGETTSDAAINFAIHELWLGDTDKSTAFTPDPKAWTTFGYNIDGKITTSLSTDVCTLAPTAPPSTQVDGEGGSDNSFGENIVSSLNIAFIGASQDLSSQISAGTFTLMLDTTGLSTDPLQTNVGLTAQLFGGARFPGTPTFTAADNWPVDPSSLADGQHVANGSKVSLSGAYVVHGTWVSGRPTDLVFQIQVQGRPLLLTLHHAVITFQHTVDDAGASHATRGMAAGILRPSELLGGLELVAAGVAGKAYCGVAAAFQSKASTSVDILLDGTNEPGQACNGISAAIAFTADQIQLPSRVGAALSLDASVPPCDAAKD